jgi:hypothetical protein
MIRLLILCLLLAAVGYAGELTFHADRDGTIVLHRQPCDADRELVDDLRREIERAHAELRGLRAMIRARRGIRR